MSANSILAAITQSFIWNFRCQIYVKNNRKQKRSFITNF